MFIDLTLLISCTAPHLNEFMSCSEYHESALYLQDRFSIIFMSAWSANETLGDDEFRCGGKSTMRSMIDVEPRIRHKVKSNVLQNLDLELEEECEDEY